MGWRPAVSTAHSLTAVLVLAILTATWSASGQEPDAIAAWNKIDDKLSAPALSDYLKKFPNSSQAGKARIYLRLAQNIAEIRSGKLKSSLVIPFDSLAPSWSRWRAGKNAYEGRVGILYRGSSGEAVEANPRVFDDDGELVLPSKDGSILIFETDEPNPTWQESAEKYLGGAVISAKGSDPVYFGIFDRLGLVHLYGACSVRLKDGTIRALPELEESTWIAVNSVAIRVSAAAVLCAVLAAAYFKFWRSSQT